MGLLPLAEGNWTHKTRAELKTATKSKNTGVFPFDICISAAKHGKKWTRGKTDQAKSNASREKEAEPICVPCKLLSLLTSKSWRNSFACVNNIWGDVD
jgi:hypothetical protein